LWLNRLYHHKPAEFSSLMLRHFWYFPTLYSFEPAPIFHSFNSPWQYSRFIRMTIHDLPLIRFFTVLFIQIQSNPPRFFVYYPFFGFVVIAFLWSGLTRDHPHCCLPPMKLGHPGVIRDE
jgi:hypothetical protein